MKKSKLIICSLALAMMSGSAFAAKAPESKSGGVDEFIDSLDKNFSVTSNYLFRGLSQGAGVPAVQGGFVITADSGLSAGLWTSSSAGVSTEYDITISYGSQSEKLGFEFGLAMYNYTDSSNPAIALVTGRPPAQQELFGGINIKDINIYAYLNTDSSGSGNNLYAEASTEIERFNLALGVNSNKTSTSQYVQFTATMALTKELSYTLALNNKYGSKYDMAITYSYPFK